MVPGASGVRRIIFGGFNKFGWGERENGDLGLVAS